MVFAHPDDESVGIGGNLAKLDAVWFVCVTNGAPRDSTDARRAGCFSREEYAQRRRKEMCAAVREARHDPGRITFLDVDDQEASTNLVHITRAVGANIAAIRPDIVITHPYEGGHPDHDATAFAVHAAIAARRAHGAVAPPILEMTSYHGSGGGLVFGDFLPDTGPRPITISLGVEARKRKRRLLACHESQTYLLEKIPVECERLRRAPNYDFTQPPHPGRLFYEYFPWGMTGERWRQLAATALSELGLNGIMARGAAEERVRSAAVLENFFGPRAHPLPAMSGMSRPNR